MHVSLPLSAIQQRYDSLDRTCPLHKLREQAWHILQQRGLSTSQAEAYKYTPIAQVLPKEIDLSQPAPITSPPQATVDALLDTMPDAYHAVWINGRLSLTHSRLVGSEPSLALLTLKEGYAHHNAALTQHIAQAWGNTPDVLAALNTLLYEEGVFLYIKPHSVLDKPLILHHLVDARQQPVSTAPRCLVVAGQHSHTSLLAIEHTLGTQPSLTNAYTQVILERAACLNHHTLQIQDSEQAHQVHHLSFIQREQSTLNTYCFTWGGALVRNNLHICLDAPHSEANLYGLYYLTGQQHVDHHTQVDHRQPHTDSNEHYKGIVCDTATGVFNGQIYVRPEAQKTQAFQANNHIILSDTATVHAKPQLEIWADDVRCSHGATTGQLDAQQLFYLRSRGIPAPTARHMLLQAFAHEILHQVSIPGLQTYLHQHLNTRLSQRPLTQ